MGRMIYLEGNSGISGDMTVGALLDLGGSEAKMRAALASLPFDGYALTVEKTRRWGLAGTSFKVHLHAEDHAHAHAHAHVHRHLGDVLEILEAGTLSPRALGWARAAFRIVAEAEAQAHGTSLEDVHFHEVGAVDSICDIVAACVLADDLDVTDCVVTGFSEGAGLISCAHGELPVPVPAVANIAASRGIPLTLGTAQTELVTPTGLALAAAWRTRATLPPQARIVRTGIGFGTREIGRANVLRVFALAPVPAAEDAAADAQRMWVLESTIDDATGEELAVAQEKLFRAGARDCSFVPCFMKKNRPGYEVKIVADADIIPVLEEILFRHTTTIGVRRYPVWRTVMARASETVTVEGRRVAVKTCSHGGIVRHYPEAGDVKSVAEATGESFRAVYRAAVRAAEEGAC